VFVGTLGTFHCWQQMSFASCQTPWWKETEEKPGYDSQLVVQKLRLTKDKDLVGELKSCHRFNMQTGWRKELADKATLKESADGAALVFLSNYTSLLFDPLTLQLTHTLNHRLLDILGSTVLL